MYSPRISEDLIPQLYRMAKDQKMPMTRLVNSIIRKALAPGNNNPPEGNAAAGYPDLCVRESRPKQLAA